MKIVFFGSDDFSLPFLEELLKENKEVSLVITTQDKPRGRGKKILPNPVKELANKKGIPFVEIKKSSDMYDYLEDSLWDLGIVVSFGKIIPGEVINLFKKGIINVHPSILPRYRGPNPIRWQILNKEGESGVSIMKITEGVDEGDVLMIKRIPLSGEETYTELREKLISIGRKALIEALEIIEKGKDEWKPQRGEVSYAPKFKRDFERIDWHEDAKKIKRKILALSKEPGAYSIFRGKRLKILKADVEEDESKNPGEVVYVDKKIFKIGTGKGVIFPLILKPEGKREMDVKSFIAGYRPKLREK
ncbi:MAG TPA: methionyl-tRNA formyltransferase, partial [Firmicutes bacterium]|nr:methionyl-tRNA formyltransferase [Bacillota bacterium]